MSYSHVKTVVYANIDKTYTDISQNIIFAQLNMVLKIT